MSKKLMKLLALVCISAVIVFACTEEKIVTEYVDREVEVIVPAETYNISGTITFPDLNGESANADGAVVYLKMNATEATADFDATAVADAEGNFIFTNLLDGSYFVFANYNTENQNNAGARMANIVFGGEGALVAIAGEDVTQNLMLVSLGQANVVAVNTYDGGNWMNDWGHSSIDFSFPYDSANADFGGQFTPANIFIEFDPADLANSKIEASIDLLTVNTHSPGGRDPKYNADNTLWQDAVTGEYKLGCISTYFGVSPDKLSILDDFRYATFASTTIEAYGDGYLATGKLTFNGVSEDVSMFFQYVPGFTNVSRQRQYSSFKGTLEFAAYDVWGVTSGHLKTGATVTVEIGYQIYQPI